ncbi:YceI family protein [Chondrinema litorale]|uniref:YceI family protein n=1 Tax=Chondrinema litorale TaxID=2994555 RepID=UPI002542E7E5|nr:YceI family protein [Chondrinema litorale]UZR95197.1 YceI family protein [Chondrinema litorale]
MKKTFLTQLFTACLFIAFTSVGVYAQEVTQAQVTFKIRNAGIGVDGSLGGFKGDIKFDPQSPESSTLEASVDVSTIDTGIGMRDKHLKKDDYFDVEKYPRISMKSTSIKSTGEGSYEGKFDLTIKDQTKEVTIPFTVDVSGNMYSIKGSFEINRQDFGVGGNSLTLSDDLTVSIEVEAEGAAQ